MKVLVVGAGAVGQVYGRHLQRGGCEVDFYVREKYLAELKPGVTVYPLNESRWQPVVFKGYGLMTRLEEIESQTYDQVWLCISSTALKGDWLEPFLKAIQRGKAEVFLVCMQPGIVDQEYVKARWPAERLIWNLITVISYHSPLPTETREPPGMAYWFPPLSKTPFSGPKTEVQALVKTLNKGGLKSAHTGASGTDAPLISSILMTQLMGLEGCEWSFRKYKSHEYLGLACQAGREAMSIAAKKLGRRPWGRCLVRPFTLRRLMGWAPVVIPFDIETYLKVHFTKVGDQTRAAIQQYIELGHQLNCDTSALRELQSKVFGEANAEASAENSGEND